MTSMSIDAGAAPKVAVQAAASVAGQSLVLSVRIRNAGTENVYVFSRPQDYSKFGAAPGVGALFSQISMRDDGLLVFGMIVPRVPPGLSVEVLYVPCAMLLAPGQELQERAEVLLPVDEYGPYRPHVPQAQFKIVESQGGEVWVDYVKVSDKLLVTTDSATGCHRVTGFSRSMLNRAAARIDSLRVPVRQRVESPR